LKTTQDKEKIYVDKNKIHREFKIGEHVYFKFRRRRSSLKLGKYSKLAPKYCGPFEILDRMRMVAYWIAFLNNIKTHNVFHVSLLNKYVHDPNHLIVWAVIQVELD
jgi:hypothetical protein